MAEFNFGGTMEEVVTEDEFPLQRARQLLSQDTVAVLGYGVQGPGQALNMRDNGVRIIIGQRDNSPSWDRAVEDGFVPGETLFDIEEAASRGTGGAKMYMEHEELLADPAVDVVCIATPDRLHYGIT